MLIASFAVVGYVAWPRNNTTEDMIESDFSERKTHFSGFAFGRALRVNCANQSYDQKG